MRGSVRLLVADSICAGPTIRARELGRASAPRRGTRMFFRAGVRSFALPSFAVLSVVALFAVLAPAAMGADPVGSFETDGNTPDSPAGEPTDWDGVGTPPLT